MRGNRDRNALPPRPRLRRRQRARGRRVPRADGLERGRLARAGRGTARAVADAEEPDRRAAARRARGAGVVPADHRGGARGNGELDTAARALRGEVRDRAQALPRLPAARGRRGDPQRRLRHRGVRELDRGGARGCRAGASSTVCGSRRARPSGAASSTRRSFPPRPGSTRRTSRSPRAAIPARSRSRGCTTAGARIAGWPCSRSTPRARATRSSWTRRLSAASRALSPGRRSATSGERCRRTPRCRSAARRRGYTCPPAPVAQGIERCPAEAEVASSNLAGRIAGSTAVVTTAAARAGSASSRERLRG